MSCFLELINGDSSCFQAGLPLVFTLKLGITELEAMMRRGWGVLLLSRVLFQPCCGYSLCRGSSEDGVMVFFLHHQHHT